MPNRFTPIQAGTEASQMLSIINKNFGELDNEGVKKLYSGADGIPRIYIDGTAGTIKVAPAGVDVTTAADSVLLFNSSQKVFKIVNSGSLSLSAFSPTTPAAGNYATTETTLATYTHNLGYVPAFIAFLSGGSDYWMLPYVYHTNSSGTVASWFTLSVQVTTTTLAVSANQMNYGGSAYTFNTSNVVRFYLLQETAN